MAAGGQSSTWAAPGSHSGQVAAAAPPSGGETQGEQAKLIDGREQQVGFGGASKVLLSVWGRTADSGEVEKQSVVGGRSMEGDNGRPRGERQPPNRVQEAATPSEQEAGEEGKTGR